FMELAYLIIIAILVVALVLVLSRKRSSKPHDQLFVMLQTHINELARTIDSKLTESSRIVQTQFGESTKIIREITQELTRVNEGQKQVMNVTEQLKNLQDILKNPKQRGILGEYYLETVLSNVLPPGSYQIQYPFKDGTIVDAVVFYQEKIIPIDSKFSLENYNRLLHTSDETERKRYEEALRQDLKNRIDETSKYIKPSEDTMEFAFMFIPSEALYYDLLINKVGSVTARDLVSYAASEKKVIIVSPTSFLAYLQTVLQGMRQANIQKSTEQILKNVGNLGRHLVTYDDYFQKLGKHLGTSVSMYNQASKEFKKIDKDVMKISGETMNIEPNLLQGPEEDSN
ncbi:MAG: DNA recombination protein RmuC, partial [Patescibacteria group bacterium]